MTGDVIIQSGSIETAVALSKCIPEFENPHPVDEYYRRMSNKTSRVLIAYVDDKPVGFKVGYDKFGDGSFYSWMGGVLPAYRNRHIAKTLADHQESWAKSHGFKSIRFKTRNRHKAMLMFAIANGFSIVSVEPRDQNAEHRIMLEKQL